MKRITRKYIDESYEYIKSSLDLEEFNSLEPIYIQSLSFVFDYVEELENKLAKYEEPVVEFEGKAYKGTNGDEAIFIDNGLGEYYSHWILKAGKTYKVIVIEDKGK